MKKIIISLTLCYLSNFAIALPRTIPAYSLGNRAPEKLNLHNTINVIEGNQFTITLHGNSGTGYTWYIKEPSEDYITLIAKHVIPCKHPGGRTTTIFRFHAMAQGHETLVFEYARPWSWTVEQKQTYEVIVTPRTNPLLR